MKQKINRFWTWLLGGVLTLLGFAGCGKQEYNHLLMYGSPEASYKFILDAIVTDEGEKPIPGIRVVFDPYQGEDRNGQFIDTLYTDASGRVFEDLKMSAWGPYGDLVARFDDMDGAENGSFESKVLRKDQMAVTGIKKDTKVVTIRTKLAAKAE